MSQRFKPEKRASVLVALTLLCGVMAWGQFSSPTSATVGVPYTFDVGQGIIQEIEQIVGQYSTSDFSFSFQASFTATGVPPGLTFSQFGVLSGTPTTAGTYTFSPVFNETYSFTIQSMTFGPYSYAIPFGTYNIVVSQGSGPAVTASPSSLSFSLTQGSAPMTQSITVTNRGATPVAFQASVSGKGLTASVGGTAPAFGSGSITVTATPSSPGTYTGAVSISGSFPGSPLTVPVVVTVTGSQPLLSLSQSGLFFRGSAGGPAPPAQSFTVSNGGVGSLTFTATASVFAGGNWLSVSPAGGQSSGSSAPALTVQVNPTGLAAGTYYGQIQVSAAGVPNSPQAVAVVLNLAATATNVDPDVRPTGMIFVGKQGGTSPASKPVTITNLGSTPVSYVSTVSYSSGTGWLAVSPSVGSVAAGTPATPSVTVSPGTLAPGIYLGQIGFIFKEPNTIHNITVLFIVLPSGSVAEPVWPSLGGAAAAHPEAGGCTATKLLPVFSSLGQSFTNAAAWPSSIEVTAADDCGNPMMTGSMVVSFSTGDEPISLTSLNDGRWSGTWTPHTTTNATVSLTATAQTYTPALSGTAMIGGTTNSNPAVPLVKSGGIVNAASNAASTPVAPGSYISIYGSGLGSGLTVASAPFPATLGGTQVLLAGQPIPLYFTSDGQINALVPYGLTTNNTLQVVVTRGGAYSTPTGLTFADGGPAVFLNAQGGGIAVGVKADGTQYLVDANHPTTAGDYLVVYCAGLGAVNQSVTAGTVSPASPPATTVNTVTATIEGISAPVAFAGLAPGFAGLYQVNLQVPPGLTPSSKAPLVLTVSGQSSPGAPIAVQ